MMVRIRQFGAMMLLLAASAACAQPFRGEAIAIAGDKKGIGFDDLRYSPSLHRVLVPAGRTGNLVLVDPSTHQPSVVARLGKEEAYGGGHGEGTTSADEGEGALYGIDRTTKEVDIIDYDPARRHLYLPGGSSATMTIFSVGTNGALTPLVKTPTARGAHRVTTDGKDAYVCDPDRGRILVVHDSFPPAEP